VDMDADADVDVDADIDGEVDLRMGAMFEDILHEQDILDMAADRMTLACIAGQADPGTRNMWAVGT
jgi:hypothetical protein